MIHRRIMVIDRTPMSPTMYGIKPFSTPTHMATIDPARETFEEAKRVFLKKLKDPGLEAEISTITTVGEVYKEIAKLQEQLAGKRQLRNWAKIRPFLDRLSSYAGVVEVIIQANLNLL
jgi:hypothetical protein